MSLILVAMAATFAGVALLGLGVTVAVRQVLVRVCAANRSLRDRDPDRAHQS